MEDIGVDAVKIGMLHSPEVVRVVAAAIRHHRLPHVVLDPVMVATSGDRLIADGDGRGAGGANCSRWPRVITPNLDEAELLLGHAIAGIDALEAAARDLLALGAQAVLLKGGHLQGNAGGRRAAAAGATGAAHGARAHRQPQRAWHGLHAVVGHRGASGAGLACRRPCTQARAYVCGAIAAGADVRTGHGHGPLNHGFAPRPTQRLPL